ncbi:unnamed protein product [Pleuronectes platessa]|uniref:Uncharacterized protein n=1 Tax=Pleuronectes platessa TaxID=8262 RepID=A0A9N7VW21_PLEPL|nr:unnamed protein product [Pleuronectes platessa]
MPLCSNIFECRSEADKDFMAIASPRKGVVELQEGWAGPLSGAAGGDEVSLSMSELLRAATYATTSRFATRNLARRGISLQLAPYSNSAQDSLRIHNHSY